MGWHRTTLPRAETGSTGPGALSGGGCERASVLAAAGCLLRAVRLGSGVGTLPSPRGVSPTDTEGKRQKESIRCYSIHRNWLFHGNRLRFPCVKPRRSPAAVREIRVTPQHQRDEG